MALHDQVTPSLPSSLAMASARGQIVGERVVVEEEFLHLRESLLGPRHLLDDVTDAAGSVAMTTHGLRPQAECAARLAAASGVERQVRMLQIPDEVVLDPEVPLVNGRNKGQRVHVFQDRPRVVVHDPAFGIAVGKARDPVPVTSLGHFLDREVELVAGDEVDCLRRRQTSRRIDSDLGADQSGLQGRVDRLHRLDRLDIRRERGRRRVQYDQVVLARSGRDIGKLQAVRWRIDQLATLDQRRRLGEPSRIPERADFATTLEARTRTSVEAVERRRLQEKRAHHIFETPTAIIVPSARTL